MGLMSPDMFRAVVPPAKKQRAGATPPIHGVSQQQPFGSTLATESNVPDDVARRRAELALLEEKMNKSVVNRGSAPPPRPPPPAPPLPMDRVRHSDIFPSVQKSAAELNPIDSAPLSPGSMGGSITPLPPPIISPRSAESLATSPVARRLDAAFESNPLRPPPPPPPLSSVTPAPPSRPKSAPPSRPPPPPPPPTTRPPLPPGAPPAVPPPRGYTPRPEPVVVSVPPPKRVPPLGPPMASNQATETDHLDSSNRSMSSSTGSRRRTDILREMYAVADTPPSMKGSVAAVSVQSGGQAGLNMPTHGSDDSVMDDDSGRQILVGSGLSDSSTDLRLLKELKQTKDDYSEALRKVAELEDLLQRQQQPPEHSTDASSLQMILELAESHGPLVAINQAREQLGLPPLDPAYFAEPSTPTGAADTRAPRRRPPTPYPRRAPATESEVEREWLVPAVESVPLEYFANGTAFTIRRPMGIVMETGDRDMWMANGEKTAKLYARDATVFQPTSLEVLAHISLDGSILVIHGSESGRFLRAGDSEWQDFGPPPDEAAEGGGMDESNRSLAREKVILGEVLYIAADGSEQMYSLDDIYDGACSVREQYCAAVLSMAALLRQQKTDPGANQAEAPALDTKPPAPTAPSDSAKKPKAPPPEDEGSSGGGVLGFFVNCFFGIIWTVFVRIPLGIMSTTFYLLISIILLKLLWLYFADDHGAATMGAYIHNQYYNHPLTGIR
jgi:hypothetical protein